MEAGAVNATVACAFPGVPAPIVGAPGTVPTIPNICCTVGAARYVALPATFALITHCPNATIVTLLPDTRHIAGDPVLKVTGKPDGVAVATSGSGVEVNVCVPGFVKLIV